MAPIQVFLFSTLFVTSLEAQFNPVFTNLYTFGRTNGAYPEAGLVLGSDGNFYGTTSQGGTNGSYGTVFKISTNGTFTSLCSFNDTDGAYPYAGLVQGSDGNFYGTTEGGGTNGGYGTVFKISPAGVLSSLYSFTGGNDGAYPQAGLVQGTNGNFYGTTTYGGTASGLDGYGTVFEISPNGMFTSLHSFTEGNDGGNPYAGLVQGSDGNFYGTTESGGTNGFGKVGTVFKITTAGGLTALYSFTGGNNGASPEAGLVEDSDSNFYGTTYGGGFNNEGTVFKITAAGVLTTLYSFGGLDDGAYPQAGLVPGSDGNFYGTTSTGTGSIFEISPSGSFTNFYIFNYDTGSTPEGGLVQDGDGNFYGTTASSGSSGYGIVFRLSTGFAANPVVQFTANPTNGVALLTVQFNSPNVDSLGNAIVSWNWNFGDGATSALQNPSHTYTSAGTFTPTLVATNVNNAAVIGNGPQIAVASPSSSGSQGQVLFFDNFEQFTNGVNLSSTNYIPASGPAAASVITSIQNGTPTITATNFLGNVWALFNNSVPANKNQYEGALSSIPTNQTLQLTWKMWIQATNTGTGVFLLSVPTDNQSANYNPPLGFEDTGSIFVFTNGTATNETATIIGNWGSLAGTVMTNTLILNYPGGNFTYSLNGQALATLPLGPYFTNVVYGIYFDGVESSGSLGNRFAIADVEVVVPSPTPFITGISLSGTNLVLDGINGVFGETNYVLMSTNLALPLNQWARVATNILSANGSFTVTVTNTVSKAARQRFYILQMP